MRIDISSTSPMETTDKIETGPFPQLEDGQMTPENGAVSGDKGLKESHAQETPVKEPSSEGEACTKTVSIEHSPGKSNNQDLSRSRNDADADIDGRGEEPSEKRERTLKPPGESVGLNTETPASVRGHSQPDGSLPRPQSTSFLQGLRAFDPYSRLQREIDLRGSEICIRDREIARLKSLLAKKSQNMDVLRDKIEEQEERFLLAQQKSFRPMEQAKWITREDSSIRSDLAKFEREVRSFARKFANADLSILQQASGESQEKLIAELGWSVRETDPNVPSWIFGEKIKDKTCLLLIHAMLATYIVRNVFEDPFFFFQDEMATLEGITLNNAERFQEESGFSKNLNALYEEMKKVDVPKAHAWRSDTLRLLNTTSDYKSDEGSSPIKTRIEEMRKRACENLSSKFLSGPVELLIRPNLTEEEREKMRRELNNIIFNAGDVSAHLWTQRTNIMTVGLHLCGKFNVNHIAMTAHRLHHLDDDDHRLDGKPIIAVIQPGIVAWGDNDGVKYDKFRVWSKAVVMVDDS